LKKLVSGLAPGMLTIPPMRIRTSVRAAGDPFGDPLGFFRAQPVELSSKPVTLKILAIPGDRPFSGPVGRFELTSRLDKSRVAAGEAATLKVRLSGSGGLRTATEPPKVAVPGARVYPPTTHTEPPRAGKPGVVEWDYVFVPAAPGEVEVPPVTLPTFDPAEKKIVLKSTAPLRLAVEGFAPAPGAAPGTSAPAVAGAAETTVPTPAAPAPSTPAAAGSPALDLSRRTVTLPLWVLIAVPGVLVAAAGTWVALRRRRSPRVDLASVLEPEAGETKERAAARIDRALRAGLSRRYGVAEESTATAFLSALAEKGIAGELLEDTEKLFADLDFLRFAPQLGDYSAKIAEVREEAARVLPRLF
ncbi:MAG TPA: BatD family protein, partial [Thermoanaerobaculia bacterium]|nr:BatD family protein [Thermoanaerobaculia bacterium]